jgi:hypothetical protein
LIQIDSIKHFPYQNNISVRLSFNPFVLSTKKILEKDLDFKQSFYIPVHNHFNTLRVEIINSLNDGWFRDHVKETIIASFDIRMPDIDKSPFDEQGFIKLPITEQSVLDYKRLGLRPTNADQDT